MTLELRFGIDGLRLLPEITKIKGVGSVRKVVHEGIRRAEAPDALRHIYRSLV